MESISALIGQSFKTENMFARDLANNIICENSQDYYIGNLFYPLWNSLPSCAKAVNSLFTLNTS